VPQAAKRPPRLRRSRADIRERLLDSALVEFAAKGFDGASTRAIAHRVDAHQPQINYHFASKEGLWFAAVDHLFALLGQAMDGVVIPDPDDAAALADAFAEMIRRFVRFAAAHPELSRIMMHEGTEAGPRPRDAPGAEHRPHRHEGEEHDEGRDDEGHQRERRAPVGWWRGFRLASRRPALHHGGAAR